jgi:serine/threonine-protein phosphatase 2A regulatory subunit B'
VLFINEIEELMNMVDEVTFKKIRVPLFKQIGKCFRSEHFQVAERALYLWSNDHIVSLVADSAAVILPIIFAIIHYNSAHHWNRTIRNLSQGSLQLFQEIDGFLYSKLSLRAKEDEEQRRKAALLEFPSAHKVVTPPPSTRTQPPTKPSAPVSLVLPGITPTQTAKPAATAAAPAPAAAAATAAVAAQTPAQPAAKPAAEAAAAASATEDAHHPKPLPEPVVGGPAKGPGPRRKSLLPVDPTTLALLANHKSLEDLIASHDQNSDSDYDDDSDDADDSEYSSDNESDGK